MVLFLSLNCSEDLKQALKPWVPIGLGHNWLTDAFIAWIHGSNCDNFCHAFFAYPCGLHTFFSMLFPRLSPLELRFIYRCCFQSHQYESQKRKKCNIPDKNVP